MRTARRPESAAFPFSCSSMYVYCIHNLSDTAVCSGIGMARLFFARPDFAIVDEATSAVSQDVEVQLYEAAAKQKITCITISQRLALKEYHTQELRLGEDTLAGWSIHTV